MAAPREAVIVDTTRTFFGKRGGALAGWHPADLLGFTLKELLTRARLDPERVDDVIGGCVSQVGEQSTNVARNAWVAAGLPQSVPATTVDRQCGSSQQAVHFAAAGVVAGHYDIAIACGVESMSRVPLASNARGGTGPFPPVLPGADPRPALDAVPGGPGPGRRMEDQPGGHGRLRPGEPPPGGRGHRLGPLRPRGHRRPPP